MKGNLSEIKVECTEKKRISDLWRVHSRDKNRGFLSAPKRHDVL
jgi:hypothetical protein